MQKNIKKSVEIKDAKISFVSLVDRAANRREFLIAKSDNKHAKFSTFGKIIKVDTETHYVTGIVYEPLVADSQDDFMTEDEIRKAAYWFAKNGDSIDIQHSFKNADGIAVVENYVAPCEMTIGDTSVVKGTWIITVEISNIEIWKKIQNGAITGFSMGGTGEYSETDVDISEGIAKKGLLKRLAGVLGLNAIEKGEVTDLYNKNSKSNNFWAARSALEDTLYKYNRINDRWEYETDEQTIREALTEFTDIMTNILVLPDVRTAFESLPVEKTGKKLSNKNRDTLQMIYDTLGSLLNSDTSENKDKSGVSEDKVKEMIEKSMQEIIEPVLRSRTFPSNLNNVQHIVEKNDQHYLAGVL